MSITDIRVTSSGVTAILTPPTAGGAPIDPISVKATIGGVGSPVSVQPMARERRVTTLLFDTSGSMGAAGMETVVSAANAFLASVPADVYVGAVAFSTVPKVIASPTLDRAIVRAAIAGLRSSGETSLYDGLAATLAQLGTAGDRSFILLSDGGDTRSRRTLAQTMTALAASGVRAQVVGLKTDQTQGSVLNSLAAAGHGSVVAAGNSAAVSAAFTVAAQALESQIRVAITVPHSAAGITFMVVSANASGKALQSRTSVNLAVQSPALSSASPAVVPAAMPAAAPAPGPGMKSSSPATVEEGPGRPWLVWLALLGVFLGLGGVVGALAMPAHVSHRQRGVEAIEDYFTGPSSSQADERSVVSSISASLVNLGDKVMDSRTSTPKTQMLLERADLPLRPGEWAVLRVVAVVVGVAGGIVLMRGSFVSMFVGSCLGVLLGVV